MDVKSKFRFPHTNEEEERLRGWTQKNPLIDHHDEKNYDLDLERYIDEKVKDHPNPYSKYFFNDVDSFVKEYHESNESGEGNDS
jgi:hypothetical protein